MVTLRHICSFVSAAALAVAGLVVAAAPAQALAPAPPIKYIEVLPDQQTLRVSWDHIGVPVVEYEVWYRPAGTTTWIWSSSSEVGSGNGSFVPYEEGRTTYTRDFKALGITPGNSYDISVRTYPTSGSSDASDRDANDVRVKTNPPLGALTTTGTSTGSLTMSWPAYTATPFYQYDYYLTRGTVTTPSWNSFNQTSSTTSKTWTGLIPGATYTVGLRVSQAQDRLNNAPINWVRSAMVTKTFRVPSNEPAYSTSTHPFVSTTNDQPIIVNGVNVKRGPNKNSAGVWQTPYIQEEIVALGASGAPAFNTVRIALDMPYFWVQNGTTIGKNDTAFAHLDTLIEEAVDQGLYIILDPIHANNVGTTICAEDPLMAGAHKDVPAWAWVKVGMTPGTTCETTNAYNEKFDDVLALQETADYLKFVIQRYGGGTTWGNKVIGIDLVNEPSADGADAAARTTKLINSVYTPWLAPSGSKSLRAVEPDKVFIVEPVASVVGVDLSPVAKPNVALSFHDYFGQARGTNATYGLGYSSSGYPTAQEWTDQVSNDAMGGSYVPYNPTGSTGKSYASRKTEHQAYIEDHVDLAAAAGMPLFVGEYGIRNPCGGGQLTYSTQYAKDRYSVYQSLGLSRTYWAHGYWDAMALWYRQSGGCGSTAFKTYFPYAAELTGGVVRP